MRAAVSSGFRSCSGRGSRWLISRREASNAVTYIRVGDLIRVCISPGSLNHHISGSRQKLTFPLLAHLRAKLNFRIRRFHEVISLRGNQLEIYSTICFNLFNGTIRNLVRNRKHVFT